MAFSVALGRVIDTESVVHRLDARVKTVAAVGLGMLSFLVDGPVAALVLAAFAVLAVVLSRVPLGELARAARPFVVLLAFSFVVNCLVVRGGATLVEWGPFTVGTRGVETGALVAFRAAAALTFGVLLVLTTSPLALAGGLERLLAPLSRVRVPVQDVAMVLAIALRTVPLLADEAARIAAAQRARGAGGNGSLRARVQLYASAAVPLLAGSLRHAERLALAMEARCYGAPGTRTSLTEPHFARRDVVATCVLVAVAAIILTCLVW